MDNITQEMLLKITETIDISYIGKAIIETILFIILLKIVNKTLHLFFEKVVNRISDTEVKKQYMTVKQLCLYIVDAILLLFFTTNILEHFGINMKPILATAGVLGVAVGLGGKKFVEDLLTGLLIIFTGQLRVGDYVTVNKSTGFVEKITLTMIVIRSFNGDVHYIRNGQIDTIINQTKNYSFPIFNFSVAYKTDITHAMKVLKDAGQELRNNEVYSRFVLSDLEVLGLNEFQNSSIVIQCRIKTTPQEQWMVKRKFNQIVKEKFEKEGIEIPFPQVVVTQAETQSEAKKEE